jgi:acyl dehydratase
MNVHPMAIRGLEDLVSHLGRTLGPSAPVELTQERVDRFADVTGDHQWIHVDVERAAAGPFGGTIAHGYLTLSLLPLLAKDLVRFEDFSAVINYGLDRVRFPAPVRVGSRLRATAEVMSAVSTPRGVRAVVRYTVTDAETEQVSCVADAVSLLVGGSA